MPGDHIVHYYSEFRVKFRHNLIRDIFVDIYGKYGISVCKKESMRFLLEDEKDIEPSYMLLFNGTMIKEFVWM